MMLAGTLDWLCQHAREVYTPEAVMVGVLIGASLTALVYVALDCIRQRPSLRPFEELSGRLPWTSFDIRSLLMYWFGSMILIFGLVVVLVGPNGADSMPCTQGEAALAETILLQGALLLFIVGRLKTLRMSARFFLGVDKTRPLSKSIPLAIVLCLAALPVVFMADQLWNHVLTAFGVDISEQEALTILKSSAETVWVRGLLVGLAGLIGPVLEDAIFRGILLPILVRQFGAAYGITIVSLIFSVFHPQIEAFLPIFAISVFFCLGYAWSGSLLVPMLMHILFNSIQLLYLFVAQ